MSNPPLQEPPLPRYRFDEATGKWAKEGTRKKPTPTAPPADPNAFNSSYDYFLRRSYAVENKVTKEQKVEQEKKETMKKIDNFEAQHLSDDSAPLRRTEVPSETPIMDSGNPLLGLLSGVSLGTVYRALVSLKGSVTSPSKTQPSPVKRQNIFLDFEDFQEFLSVVQPGTRVSEEYEREMYDRLTKGRESQRLTTYDLFSFLVNHTLHRKLDLAVEMIFFAFDVEKRGLIPVEALHPRVMEAWAEENTFGNLRDSWFKLADALRQEEHFLGNNMMAGTPFLDMDSVRALLCSSDYLFEVANSVNLEGGASKGKSTRKN